MELPQANKGKNITINVNGIQVERYPIRTKLFVKGDDIVSEVSDLVVSYLGLINHSHKVIVIGEKAVASSQGRAFLLNDIHPGSLAKFLSSFVTKTKAGIGLGIPETMQLAIKEVGLPRILLAFFVAAITRPFGIKGMFYRIAGDQARSVDGPTPYTIPPYNQSVVLGPKNPNGVANAISKIINLPVAIIDANDIGQNILGFAGLSSTDLEIVKGAFKDNPLGQSIEQTPVALVAWNN